MILLKTKTFYVNFVVCSCLIIFLLIPMLTPIAAYSKTQTTHYSALQIEDLIKKTILQNNLNVIATEEVIAEINHMLNSTSSRDDMRATLMRLKTQQKMISTLLKTKNMPQDLIVIPIIESQYKDLLAEKNSQNPAGIWQMVAGTAHKYGLNINRNHDDRLNPELETAAALNYINYLYSLFHDWRLVIIAYKLGDDQTLSLIKRVGSRDPWVLARSSAAPADLKRYLAVINTDIIIIHNPDLIGEEQQQTSSSPKV